MASFLALRWLLTSGTEGGSGACRAGAKGGAQFTAAPFVLSHQSCDYCIRRISQAAGRDGEHRTPRAEFSEHAGRCSGFGSYTQQLLIPRPTFSTSKSLQNTKTPAPILNISMLYTWRYPLFAFVAIYTTADLCSKWTATPRAA